MTSYVHSMLGIFIEFLLRARCCSGLSECSKKHGRGQSLLWGPQIVFDKSDNKQADHSIRECSLVIHSTKSNAVEGTPRMVGSVGGQDSPRSPEQMRGLNYL